MYLNLKGTYTGYQTQLANEELDERIHALKLAADALGVDYHIDAIQAEMNERRYIASLELQFSELFADDYSEWMQETRYLRTGG